VRDFVHVTDVVSNIAALSSTDYVQVVNVGGGTALRDVAEAMRRAFELATSWVAATIEVHVPST